MGLGSNCARFLKLNRKKYLKRDQSPFKSMPHQRKAMVVGFYETGPKQPNAGNRYYVRVVAGTHKTLAFVQGDGIRGLIKTHDIVRIQSLAGSKGRSMGDLSGCRYKVTMINGVAVKELFLKKKTL